MLPQDAIEILRKHGVEVTIEQAEEILKFMKTLANIQVAQCLRKQEESQESAVEKL